MNRIAKHYEPSRAEIERLIEGNAALSDTVCLRDEQLRQAGVYNAAITKVANEWKGHAKFWERLFWSVCCSFAGLFIAFFCLLFGVK